MDGVGQADQVALDPMLIAALQRLTQPGGGRGNQRLIGAERLPDRCRPRRRAAAPRSV